MTLEIVALLLGFLIVIAILSTISIIHKRRHFLKIAEIDSELAAEYVKSRKRQEDDR